jgi:hypothetical protein
MTYSQQELIEVGAQPLAQWLIEVALKRDCLSYGAAKVRLESEHGFSKIFPTHMGGPAGRLMHDIQIIEPDAPLLNVLLVRSLDEMPGEGAGWFMASRFGKSELGEKGVRKNRPKLWRKYFEKAASEVYAYSGWEDLFEKVYGSPYKPDSGPLAPFDLSAGTEKDGQKPGGGGEGANHKFLRLWVKNNPGEIISDSHVRAETEVVLKSADRVDVVYYLKDATLAIEVKSKDSNELDLERGIYQCIKYRAVMQAMDPRTASNVSALLVTEQPLPGHLKELAKRLAVPHKLVSPKKDT